MIELINYCLQLTIYSYQKIGPNQLKNWTNRKKIPNSFNHVWITNSHTCLLRHLNTLTKLHVVLHICTPKIHIVLLDTSFLPFFCSVTVFLLLLLHFGHFGDFSCVNGALFFTALSTMILGSLILPLKMKLSMYIKKIHLGQKEAKLLSTECFGKQVC